MRIGAYANAMPLCDLKGAATQFALFLACANFGTIISDFVVGWLDAVGGQTLIILSASGAGFGATVLFWNMRNVQSHDDDAGAIAREPADQAV